MKILAVESSARTCSVAVFEEKKLLCEMLSDTGLTHSQTLMQMINSVLNASNTDFESIDLLAVSIGPGSFTGIRIGIAAAKGLAQPAGKYCVGISTLEAMAYSLMGLECTVCSVMDARCAQVYTALFKCGIDSVIRLTDDNAMSLDDLSALLKNINMDKPVYIIGDGAKMFCDYLNESIPGVFLAPEPIRSQRAYGVALSAAFLKSPDSFCSAEFLEPLYLRAPQAERELKKGRDKL